MLRATQLGRRLLARHASTAARKTLVATDHCSDSGVLTLTFDEEKRLNAWTLPMMEQFTAALERAAADDEVRGVVLTGRGKYYSAGADLSAIMSRPMAPSKLIRKVRDDNERLFGLFLDFPKPIAAAVNGPAFGAAVTSAVLTDAAIASEAASFSLPFAKMGVTPEGCSSYTLPQRMGEEAAQRMLGKENWIPPAADALEAGLIDEVVPGGNEEVVARAVAVVAERIAAGGGRRYDAEQLAHLRRINADESAQLANAFVSRRFLNAMVKFNVGRKKRRLAYFFFAAEKCLPLWQPAAIAPSYEDAA